MTAIEGYLQYPNGPLIYDMMVNRSSRWRAKNLRPSILPPGWKMGISRLGRVPVYDPLYEPDPTQRIFEHPEPTAVTRRRAVAAGVPPRYQATDPQPDFAMDEYNLGLPPHLAQLYHDNMRRHGGGGVGIPGGRHPFIPSGTEGRARVPVVADDVADDDFLDESRINVLENPPIRRSVPLPPHGIQRASHHHGRHHHGHSHDELQAINRRNAELEREVDLEATVIAQQQRDLQATEQRRREEHARRQEEHTRLHQERLARQVDYARLQEEEVRRRQAEEALIHREEQLEATETELIAEGIRHRGHHELERNRQGHGHGHGRHGHSGRRVVRDQDGRAVIIDDHLPQHGELIHIPAHNPHHPHHERQHHSPPRHHPSVARAARQARHVHFADALDSSQEECIAHHRERLRQEAYPLSRRWRFDRERSPYHYLEDDLGEFARDEFYDSADEYYPPHERLLMPPHPSRQGRDWWEDAELGSGDDD